MQRKGSVKKTRRRAPAASAAPTLTLDTTSGLQVGDCFTIAGQGGAYRVTGVKPSYVTYEPLEAPVSAFRFWWPWVAGLAGIVALVVWVVVR